MGPPTFTRSQDQPHRRTHALELAARKSLKPQRHRTLTQERLGVLFPLLTDWLDGATPSLTGVGVSALAAPDLQLELEMTVRVPE